MTKYVYKINGKEVTRDKFSRCIAEDCEPKEGMRMGDFGVLIADYERGEEVTKQMQGRAYREYKQSEQWGRPRRRCTASTIYVGGRHSVGLEVEYWPNGREDENDNK